MQFYVQLITILLGIFFFPMNKMEHKESKVKCLRYSIVIRQVLDATGIFNKTIYIPFTPDEVKTKQIVYNNAGAGGIDAFSLNCDGLVLQQDSNLGFFIDPVVSFSGITYTLGRPVNGSYQFRILTASNVPTITENGGRLQVHLEFRKYL
jgi:hypothetical protein